MPECQVCGVKKTDSHVDEYNPMQLLMQMEAGWYSGSDGEICGDCMTELYQTANKID